MCFPKNVLKMQVDGQGKNITPQHDAVSSLEEERG